ncbi:hypothetical protein ACUOFC_14790, partial [Escherichia sp. TWPC-MK]
VLVGSIRNCWMVWRRKRKPPKSARQIFQYLRELAENEG